MGFTTERGIRQPLSTVPNYSRLRELKTKYDPENLFHGNVNVRPA